MYEYINGKIARLNPAYAVLDCGGVGYYLNISLQTFSSIEKSETALLYVHFIVREDAQILYGFATPEEREVFRLLLGVSGVGGNTARTILSTFSPSELTSLIANGNAETLKSVKGLGLKTAQKIIVELRGKAVLSDIELTGTASPGRSDGRYDEAIAALVMLGFSKAASDKVLRPLLESHPDSPVEEIIRLTLKRL